MRTNHSLLSVVLPIALFAGSARAQFVGDLFFAVPAVTVAEGDAVELEVRTFAGTTALGAVSFDVRFAAGAAVVEAVVPADQPELLEAVVADRRADGVAVVALNGESSATPIGTIAIARLRVRPLVPAGSVVALTIAPRALLSTGAAAFAATRGLAGSISVTSAAPTAQLVHAPSADEPPLQAGSWGEFGLPELAPTGVTVTLYQLVLRGGMWRAVPQPARTVAAERDAPR